MAIQQVKAVRRGSSTSPSSSSGILWEDASSKLTRRSVFMLIYGETGTGRTTFALSAPGPIALLHSSEKLEGVIQPYASKIGPHGDGRGGIFNFGVIHDPAKSEQAMANEADAMVRKVKAAWEDAKKWARTIIIDTDTDLWALMRLARFGKLTQVKPHHYGPVNAEWKAMFQYFRSQDDHNLICVGMLREQYRNDKPTGKTEHAGQSEMMYLPDVTIRTECDPVRQEFSSVIEKPWWNSAWLGKGVEGEMSDFPRVMGLLTEKGEEEWAS